MYKGQMSMYVTIDTSALIAVIGNEESRQKIIEKTEGCSLCAPKSVHWEIGNAFSAMFKRKQISLDTAKQALVAYNEIPIKLIDVSLENTLEITNAQSIYAYDAYLIQCAQQTGTSILTLDNGLITVANKMGIPLLEIGS